MLQYNIGWFAIGRDWWTIVWSSPDNKTTHVSTPSNFRGVIYRLESVSLTTIVAAAVPVGFMAGNAGGPAVAVATGPAVAIVGSAISDVLFDKETTDGFKEHILRQVDQNRCTKITVNQDTTITFDCASATSHTVLSAQEYTPGCLGLGESEPQSGTHI